MNIGQLTHRMTVETPVLSPDGGGGFTVAWDAVDEVYAAVTDLSGQEMLQEAQITVSQPCRIVIHYRDDIDSKCGCGRIRPSMTSSRCATPMAGRGGWKSSRK